VLIKDNKGDLIEIDQDSHGFYVVDNIMYEYMTKLKVHNGWFAEFRNNANRQLRYYPVVQDEQSWTLGSHPS
jgi:16S rRNA C1402 N4-methylase RsmH